MNVTLAIAELEPWARAIADELGVDGPLTMAVAKTLNGAGVSVDVVGLFPVFRLPTRWVPRVMCGRRPAALTLMSDGLELALGYALGPHQVMAVGLQAEGRRRAAIVQQSLGYAATEVRLPPAAPAAGTTVRFASDELAARDDLIAVALGGGGGSAIEWVGGLLAAHEIAVVTTTPEPTWRLGHGPPAGTYQYSHGGLEVIASADGSGLLLEIRPDPRIWLALLLMALPDGSAAIVTETFAHAYSREHRAVLN